MDELRVFRFTASSCSAGVHDTITNYQITFGGDSAATATSDDFGVPTGGLLAAPAYGAVVPAARRVS